MSACGCEEHGGQDVDLLILVTNSFNEVLLIRMMDEAGKIKDKWVCMVTDLPKGENIDRAIRDFVKNNTQMEVEKIESLEPFDAILTENGKLVRHRVKMCFRAHSSGDITELGPKFKTAGWFTKQEIEWYWEKIDEDTRKLLRASRYSSGPDGS